MGIISTNLIGVYNGGTPIKSIYKGDKYIWGEKILAPMIRGKFTNDSTEDDWWYYKDRTIKTSITEYVNSETKEFSVPFDINTTSLYNLFYNNNLLEYIYEIPVTSRISNMSFMFSDCLNLKNIDGIEEWNTSNVTSMSYLFLEVGLTSLNVSKWNTSNVTSMSFMFASLLNKLRIEKLDLSNFDLSNVTNMSFMFGGNKNIKFISLNGFGVNAKVNISNCFYGCINWGLDNEGETVNRQSLVDTLLINSFDRASAGYSVLDILLTTSVFNRLTDDEKAQITAKGYTLTVE